MPDMLVKLYKVKEDPALEARLAANGIQLKRALAPDIQRITGFVRENFGDGWANECLAGILRDGCWIAVKDKKVVGFACFEATRPNYFGPTGVLESMRAVGLDENMANQSPFALSGGQKRRVAIAGILAMRPDVLVLDEPTAGLDPAGRDEILGLLQRYHDRTGATVLIVSHSMEDIARIADRLLVMDHAKVLFCDTPREVFSHADEIITAGLDIPMITKVMRELKKRGHDVDTSVFTVAQALDALRACKRKGGAR